LREASGAAMQPRMPNHPPPARDPDRWVRFHGRRNAKTLRAGRRAALATGLEAIALTGVAPRDNPDRAPLDPATLKAGRPQLWLEIGFGGGEHLLATAARRPDATLIGAEPFMNGVAAFMAAWAEAGVDNVRVLPDDARFLLELLPPACLDRVYLLYPDPWPKRRHAARRFVNPPNLDLLAPRMKAGAELRLATDVPVYAAHARAVMAGRADFETLSDAPTPWPHWPGTRYEAKALQAGREPVYMRFARRTG